ncbi:MAG: GntR family transcriptional regulator [Anaerolineae bacterium]|nr:GntR family transcriptional regulator [Anaerolineae bacterium]
MIEEGFSHPKVRSPRVQVEEALAAMIRPLPPGTQLPPEPTLAKQLGVSRATLREVMRTFAERGILTRRHGVGTFVASRIPVLESGIEILESIDSLARQMGLETHVAALEVLERKATPKEAEGLESKELIDVLVINRVITVEGKPVADLRDIVPLDYLRKEELEREDFHGSVLDLFLERGNPMLSISRTDIIAVSADAKFARRLHVSRGSALLKLAAKLYSYDEKVVDYSISYFVPGQFRFHVMRRVTHA